MEPVHAGLKVLEEPLEPATHCWLPARQEPMPSCGCVPHARVAPITHWQTVSIVLSGRPSQSLSAGELQFRPAAAMAPTHWPNIPFAQV